MRILYLNLEDKWYNLISSGEKKFEYREVKLHWTERLFKRNGKPKSFDVIKFTRANYIDPFFVDFLGVVGIEDFQSKPHYKIKLGGIRDPSELFPKQLTLDLEDD